MDKKVLMVGVQGPRHIAWYEPRQLGPRDPEVFTVLVNPDGSFSACGPYCLISYQYPRSKAPKQKSRVHARRIIPRIKGVLASAPVETG